MLPEFTAGGILIFEAVDRTAVISRNPVGSCSFFMMMKCFDCV